MPTPATTVRGAARLRRRHASPEGRSGATSWPGSGQAALSCLRRLARPGDVPGHRPARGLGLCPARHPGGPLVRPGCADPAGLRLVLLVVHGRFKPFVFHDRRVLRCPPVRFPRFPGIPGEPRQAGRHPVLGRRIHGPPGLPVRLDLRLAGLGPVYLAPGHPSAVPRPGDPVRAVRHGPPVVPGIPDRDAAGVRRGPVVDLASRWGPDPVPPAGEPRARVALGPGPARGADDGLAVDQPAEGGDRRGAGPPQFLPDRPREDAPPRELLHRRSGAVPGAS